MALEFDPEANAVYLKVNTNHKIKKTLTLGNGVYLDVAENNEPVGIEVILAKKKHTKDEVDALKQLAAIKNK